jgi:hypothetical protein
MGLQLAKRGGRGGRRRRDPAGVAEVNHPPGRWRGSAVTRDRSTIESGKGVAGFQLHDGGRPPQQRRQSHRRRLARLSLALHAGGAVAVRRAVVGQLRPGAWPAESTRQRPARQAGWLVACDGGGAGTVRSARGVGSARGAAGRRLFTAADHGDSRLSLHVTSLLEDRSRGVWVGMLSGLYRLHASPGLEPSLVGDWWIGTT